MDSCSSFGRSIQTGVTEILNVRLSVKYCLMFSLL